MPIRPHLGELVYEPELLRAMGQAYESVCRELSLNSDRVDRATTMVAATIIWAVNQGETDSAKLHEAALGTFQRRTG
jgi:hypothetical protein